MKCFVYVTEADVATAIFFSRIVAPKAALYSVFLCAYFLTAKDTSSTN